MINEKIYYFKAVRIHSDDEFEAQHQLIEYNMEGELVHTYKEVFPDDTSCGFVLFRGSTLLIIRYPSECFCVKMVHDGKLTVLSNLEDYSKDYKDRNSKRIDTLFDLQRFDQLLLGFSFVESEYHVTFVILDLKSGKKITEIEDSRMVAPYFWVNWNMEEVVVTFYDRDRFLSGLFFKVRRANEWNTNIYLKHLARLAVLTSFSPDYLIMQNLPSSIFRFLGLEK